MMMSRQKIWIECCLIFSFLGDILLIYDEGVRSRIENGKSTRVFIRGLSFAVTIIV